MEYKDVEIYQTPGEQTHLRNVLKQVKDIPGDLIEVGVYQGGSAIIIREEIPDKDLYLFDTFEGFADQLDKSDPTRYKIGDCSAEIGYVEKLMKDQKNVTIVKGVFPDTAGIVKNKKFAFAHIDVDIYNATKESLEFIYPRMSKGGIILIHDYPAHDGVKKAVDEFMVDKDDEQTILVDIGRQLMIKKA
jgi:O-methyltransferase